MVVVRRAVLASLVALVLSGCTQPWMQDSWRVESTPPRTPSATPSQPPASPSPSPTSPSSPTPDPERERYPYDGSLVDGECVAATRALLDELEGIAGLAPASFSHGALVKSNDQWWTVAVATRLNPDNPDAASQGIGRVLWFVTNGPTLAAGHSRSSWPLDPDPDDQAADRVLTCLYRVPSPPPDPPDDSPASYTGQLAPGATCVAASTGMLAHLERVGRVGGAVTYPRGQLVAANKNWWTVAVATQVHPNKLGLTRENVPEVVYFATNAPTKPTGAVYFALDSIEQDTAAAAARECLNP